MVYVTSSFLVHMNLWLEFLYKQVLFWNDAYLSCVFLMDAVKFIATATK